MNRPSPYAGYGGPPPRPNYGGPSQHMPQPPSHGGMGTGYGAGPYGMPSGPPPYAQGPLPPPPPMMGPAHGGPYGVEGYRPPPMPHGGPMPPQQGGAFNNGPLPPYGSPIHYNAGPPSGPARPHMQAGPMGNQGRMGPGPQKRSYDDQAAGGNGMHSPSSQSGVNNSHQQMRKRSRAGGDDGSPAVEGGQGGDKSYAEYLEERLARERPCRTLFVRNIDFTTNVGELRGQFESFGEIKTWFDLIQKRGIAFITYFDIRAAEAARNALQGARFGVRGLDVHFSLPRESEMTKRCDRDKDQGTLFIVLKRAPDDLNDQEISQLFAPFGEIKNLRPYKDQSNCRFIEFWDCRATKAAHDAIINSTYRGGTWDVKFAWDQGVQERLPDMAKHDRDRERLNKLGSKDVGGGGGGGGGGRAAVGGGGADGGQRFRPPGPGGDEGGNGGQPAVMRRWGQAQGVGPPTNGHGGAAGSPAMPQGAANFGTPPTTHPYPSPAPSASGSNAGGDSNRLEQAQKVQQLLASLKPALAGGPAAHVSSPATTANTVAAAPQAAAAPSLPSNIAALLQLAQSKASASSSSK